MSEQVQRCAVLLRGVNVGKHNRLAMADLRRVLTDLGLQGVVTYLASGNAVVGAGPVDPAGLATRIEQALHDELGLAVRVLVRTAAELAAVVSGNPFPERAAEPKKLHVAFLEHPVDSERLLALGLRHGDDEIGLGDRALYLSYATSSYDSPLNRALARLSDGGAENTATTRNWSTVRKLAELTAG